MQGHINPSPRLLVDGQNKNFSTSSIEKLIPVHVDWNRKENTEAHSTIYYDIPALVLRRGQEFSFTILFNQVFHSDKYSLSFIFKPQTWKNFPVVKIPVNGSFDGWSAKVISKKNSIQVQIFSSSDALIGKYSVLLEIVSNSQRKELTAFLLDTDVYFLFNPWVKTDACGLLSSDQIKEYVTNEHGEIYLGSSDLPQSIPWYFGQFESVVLLTAMALLNRVQIPVQQRIDPFIILRILASNICSSPGTVFGIFPSRFDIQPLSCQQSGYTSSPAILKQYLAFNGQAVQGDSGSNWQHAAIFCSLSRALGIPCRLVTVYNAITREQPMAKVNSSITGPYYLWNECWMRRDDLPKDKSGWQVMDSSSIQSYRNVRRLGPSSVAALKAGTLDLKWDTPGIYGLLNGNQRSVPTTQGTSNVKKMANIKILTKSLKNDRTFEDLTGNYVSTESSIASNGTPANQDVNIEVKIPDSLKSDEDLTVTLNTNNQSNEQRTLAVAVTLVRINRIEQASFNDPNALGESSSIPIQSLVQNFRLDRNQPKDIQLKIAEKQQLSKGCFDSLLRLNIYAVVKETGQVYRQEKYILNEENIIMKLAFDNDVIEIGQAAKLNIQIQNSPLHLWNSGRVTINGFGVLETVPIRNEHPSNNSITIPIKVVPLRLGIGRIYATLVTNSSCLSPQSIFLEVTEPAKKNIDINNHLTQQQEEIKTQPTLTSARKDEKQPQEVTSSQSAIETTDKSTPTKQITEPTSATSISITTENIINQKHSSQDSTTPEVIDKQQDTLLVPSTPVQSDIEITLCPATPEPVSGDEQETGESVEKPTTTQETKKQQDTAPISATVSESKPETIEIVTTTEEKKNEEDVTLKSAAPVESKDQNTETITTTDVVNEPQDVISTPIVVPESKTETIEQISETVTDEDRKLEAIPPLNSSVSTATDTTKNDEKKQDIEKVPLNDVSSPSSTPEERKEDDQTILSKAPPLENTIETATETTTVEEKQGGEQPELPKLSSFEKATEAVPLQSNKEEETSKPNFTWVDNIIASKDESSVVEHANEASQSNLPEVPLLKSAIDTDTQPTKDEEKTQDNQTRLLETSSVNKTTSAEESKIPASPSLDNTVKTIPENTTVEDKKGLDEQISPQTPSFTTATETVIETSTNNDKKEDSARQLPTVPSPDNTIPSEEKDDQTILSTTPSADNTTIQDKIEEDLLKVPSSDTASVEAKVPINPSLDISVESNTDNTTVIDITKVEKKEEINEQQVSNTPSLNNTTETVTETTVKVDTKEGEEGKLPTVHSLDSIKDEPLQTSATVSNTETVTETTVKEDTKEGEEGKLPAVHSLDSIKDEQLQTPSTVSNIETVTETTVKEDTKQDEEGKLPAVHSLDSTKDEPLQTPSTVSNTETVTETTVKEDTKEGEEDKLPEVHSLDSTKDEPLQTPSIVSNTETVTETTVKEDTKEGEEDKLPAVHSLDSIKDEPLQTPSTVSNIETVTETTVKEDTKEGEEGKLPAVHSLDSIKDEPSQTPSTVSNTETVTETTVKEDTKEGEEDKLPAVHSLDSTKDEPLQTPSTVSNTETVTETTVKEDTKEGEEDKLPAVHSLDSTKDEQLQTPSTVSNTETVTETTVKEDTKEGEEDKLPAVHSLDSTKDEPLQTPSTVSNTETVTEITVKEDTKEGEEDKLPAVHSLDSTKDEPLQTPSTISNTETVTETTVKEDTKEGEEGKLPAVHSLDSTKDEQLQTPSTVSNIETVTETTVKEDTKEGEEDKLPVVHSLDSTKDEPLQIPSTVSNTETVIETKICDEEPKLQKTPSLENKTETITEISPIQEKEKSKEISPLDDTEKSVIETTAIQNKNKDEAKKVSETPFSDETIEKITESTTTTINNEDQQASSLNASSWESLLPITNETPVIEHAKEDNERKSPDTSVLKITTETVTQPVTVEDQNRLLQTPSLDNTTVVVTETTTVEDKVKDEQQEQLPKIPSLDDTSKVVTEPITVQDTKNEEVPASTIPLVGNLTTIINERPIIEQTNDDNQKELQENFVTTTTDEQKIKDDQAKLLDTPPENKLIETTTETKPAEDSNKVDQSGVSKEPTLDSTTQIVSETNAAEEKKEENSVPLLDTTTKTNSEGTTTQDKESFGEKIALAAPLAVITAESVIQSIVNEPKKEGEELQPSKTASLDSVDEKPGESIATNDKTENRDITTEPKIDEDQKLQQTPPLENKVEPDAGTTTSDNQKGVEEIVAKTTVEEESKLSEIPVVVGTTEKINETPYTYIPVPENLVLDSNFELNPQLTEKHVVLEEVDVEKSKTIEAQPVREDDHQTNQAVEPIDEKTEYITRSNGKPTEGNIPVPENIVLDSSFTAIPQVDATTAVETNSEITTGEDKSTTVPAVLQTIQPIVNTEVTTTTEKIVSPSDVTENEQIQTVQETLETNKEPDVPSDELTNWVNDLLNQVGDAMKQGKDVSFLLAEPINVLDDVPAEVVQSETTTDYEDMRSWLNNLLQRLTSSTETVQSTYTDNNTENRTKIEESPNANLTTGLDNVPQQLHTLEEPTIPLHSTIDTFVKKTTIITETTTTTTTIGEDSSVPVEDSTETLKYLVQPSVLSDENHNESTDQVSTGQHIEASSDVDEELTNEVLDDLVSYAKSSTNEIIEAAMYSYILQLNEAHWKANASTIAKEINPDESVSDNSNQM